MPSDNSTHPLTEAEQEMLLTLARTSINYGLDHDRELVPEVQDYPLPLQQPRASFVTLHIEKELRGCIGSLEAYQPLAKDVAHNAHAAAFGDPRFLPLTKGEFTQLEIHISVLDPTTPMQFSSEQDLVAQLRPGIDGLILQEGVRKGTFLPSVWEQLPDAREFLQHLKLKAGLPTDYWSDTLTVKRYTTQSFPE
jgi:AmmeMemoRadiSam system protein A